MGKKDASSVHSTPVEQYRKQIGKQDYKKSKKALRSSKSRADEKKTSSVVKDSMLIFGAGTLLVLGLYAFLYWYLNKDVS